MTRARTQELGISLEWQALLIGPRVRFCVGSISHTWSQGEDAARITWVVADAGLGKIDFSELSA